MKMISVKITNPIELEKLCLLKPKIAEIKLLFKMTKKDYRILINLLFVSDNVLKEITEFLAYNYPITTQECILTPKSQSNEFFCQLNVISLLLVIITVILKSLLQLHKKERK